MLLLILTVKRSYYAHSSLLRIIDCVTGETLFLWLLAAVCLYPILISAALTLPIRQADRMDGNQIERVDVLPKPHSFKLER